MATVQITHAGITTERQAERGQTLLRILQQAGVGVSFPCGGGHTCGKCRVIASGALSEMGDSERQLLGQDAETMRLACFAAIEGDCRVDVPSGSGTDRIATDYSAAGAPPDPIYNGDYGVAVDIGTTTVVGYLFSRTGAQPLAVEGRMNDQKPYGADVLSRIVYCNEHTVAPLSRIIRTQIVSICHALCRRAGIDPARIGALCLTGNTTMLHILAQLEPRPLAYAPFTPQSVFGGWETFRLEGLEQARLYLPRCISAYVGADITCSILASGIVRRSQTTLLVDAGTNGEMALFSGGTLVCCSTAAGPAFEGAGISCGASARTGAIDAAHAENGRVVYHTIDDAPACGVCGSGLIDLTAALLETGELLPRGRFRDRSAAVAIGESGLCLTRADVSQLLLAKGAIRAGMDTLLQRIGLTYDALDEILLCGGFGSYINPVSAERIGLIPPGCAGKTRAIGNAAGTGAGRILQSRQQADEAMKIAAMARTVELSTDPLFKPNYVKAMRFPEE